jgi:hypothetical protein
MSQSFYSNVSEALTTFSFIDPLVINFGASSASLTQTKFSFDLDCDGTPDQISKLCAGSGFLVADFDGTGKVKDGSQLFGTQSGNGFADLAKHDSDKNGWIDENDPIFDKLRVWTWDGNDEPRLIGLGELGIGAVYLGYVNTNYSLNYQGPMQADGILRGTGFFLYENGKAGTVQHVDLSA